MGLSGFLIFPLSENPAHTKVKGKDSKVGEQKMLEMVAGAVRKSKSDIVLSTLAVSLYTE